MELITLLKSQNIPLRKSDKYMLGTCPFDAYHKETLVVDPVNNTYHCVSCGAHGNADTFRRQLQNKMCVHTSSTQGDHSMVSVLKKIYEIAAAFYAGQLDGCDEAADYIYSSRKLTEDTVIKFQLGYSPRGSLLYKYLSENYCFSDDTLLLTGLFKKSDSGQLYDAFRHRLMFPIKNEYNEIVAFGGRVLDDSSPKYINSPETLIFKKSNTLYGFHRAKHSDNDSFIICEGYMDVISMHQAGFTNAVASLGTALTREQCNLMMKSKSKAYVIYDMDAPGRKAAIRAIQMMEQTGIHTSSVYLHPAKDPDEFLKRFGNDKFIDRLKSAKDGKLSSVRDMFIAYDESAARSRAVDQIFQLPAEKRYLF